MRHLAEGSGRYYFKRTDLPVNPHWRTAIVMWNRRTQPEEGEFRPIIVSHEHQHTVVSGDQILDRFLGKRGRPLPEPDQAVAFESILVIVPSSAGRSDIAEDIVVRTMTVIAVQPITALLRFRNSQNAVYIGSGVQFTDPVHRRRAFHYSPLEQVSR